MKRTRPDRRPKRALARSRSLVPSNVGNLGLQQIHEVYNTTVSTSASGVVSSTTAITPAGLLLAARLTGYRAVADEVRLDLVNVVLTPILGRSSTGRAVMYIERDSTAAIVATAILAADQREKVVGTVRDPLSLTWRPQEPDDVQFNLLNPGTVSLGSFMIVADGIKDAAAQAYEGVVFNMMVRVAMTVRGRP